MQRRYLAFFPVLFAVFLTHTGWAQMAQMPRQHFFRSMKEPVFDRAVQIEPPVSADSKKVGLAVLYSLLLPGLGELYVGDYSVGKYFTIGEASLWLTYASFEVYGTWLRDDARKFASVHAGVQAAGKDDQYFVDIENHLDVYAYNEAKLRDREIDRLYSTNSNSFWQWDNDANRSRYRDLRISHDRVFNNTRFVLAAIIVNHVASAVNAARLAASHNRRLEEASLFDVRASVIGGLTHPDGLMLTVTKSF